jgi:hypothetical protein
MAQLFRDHSGATGAPQIVRRSCERQLRGGLADGLGHYDRQSLDKRPGHRVEQAQEMTGDRMERRASRLLALDIRHQCCRGRAR